MLWPPRPVPAAEAYGKKQRRTPDQVIPCLRTKLLSGISRHPRTPALEPILTGISTLDHEVLDDAVKLREAETVSSPAEAQLVRYAHRATALILTTTPS